MKFLYSLTALILFIQCINAGRILFYFPFSTKSMKITYWSLVEEMARRGHDVYCVTPFELETKYPIKLINSDPDGTITKFLDKTSKEKLKVGDDGQMPIMEMINNAVRLNEIALNDPTLKKLIDSPKPEVDMVVSLPYMSEPIYYVAYKWNASLVSFSSIQSFVPWVNSAIGQPLNTAVVPLAMLKFKMEMSFFERVANTAATFIFENVIRNIVVMRASNNLLDKIFPDDPPRPSLIDIEKNFSLALSFGHPFLLDGFEPTVPNYVHIGMMNCQPAKGFAKGDKVGDFIEKSKNGVIFVSFGSVLQASMMDEERRLLFLRIFRKFHEYDFIWKWETEHMDDKPDNLLLSKWLPQMEILAHPKTKLFISHMGQSSFQESLCHQKPMLGIPVQIDQGTNALELERLEFGRFIPYQEINDDNLYEALADMLSNKKYTENAQKYGSLLMDQINKPLDRAAWWLEHIMRHPGMYIGKTGAHRLNWIQFNLIDVYFFMAVSLMLVLYIFKTILGCIFCRKSKVKRE